MPVKKAFYVAPNQRKKPLPAKYEAARIKLSNAARNGTDYFRRTVMQMWADCEPPFQICNASGIEGGQVAEDERSIFGCITQIRGAFANHNAPFNYVAPTEQLTARIVNDPDLPTFLDDLTPQNHHAMIRRMCEYQVEMDETIRKRGVR